MLSVVITITKRRKENGRKINILRLQEKCNSIGINTAEMPCKIKSLIENTNTEATPKWWDKKKRLQSVKEKF